MAGGLLHPAYLQTNDFRPEALQSTLKEYSTCFKMGMIEGVAIIETIKKRLDGGSDEQIAKALASQSRTMVQPVEKPPAAPKPGTAGGSKNSILTLVNRLHFPSSSSMS